jgi:hypothetical protein
VQASAELQVLARVDGIEPADVRAALWEERSLVKAWTLRGTLHLHPAAELALWRRPAGHDGLPEWRDPDGVVHPALAPAEVAAARAAVWDALDCRCLTRAELAEAAPPAVRARLESGFAFFVDELCQGPPRGARVTFVRPDQWVGEPAAVADEREVVRRFLHAYGPARPADFRAWFGAPAEFDGVEEIEVEGHRAYVLSGDTEFPEPRPAVRLLPEYDVYVLGFREREHLVPEAVRSRVAAHGRGRYEGVAGCRLLLVDGVAAGLWERKRRGRRLEITVTPAVRLTRAQRAELEQEAGRFGASPTIA